NVLRLLALARIPLRPEDRRPHDPLVLMGGVCAFSNPEPVAPFMDVIVVGEGEELVAELIAAYREGYDDRARFLDALAQLEGVYVPSRYEVVYAPDGTVGEVLSLGAAPAIVTKRRLRNVNAFETVDAVKTPHAEYGHMALREVGKGCGRGCRFCLEGQVYRPVRHRSVQALSDTIKQLAAEGEKRIGLVGACVSDYPWIGELLKVVEDHGMELSISSLRADSLTDDLAASLARGGPSGGSRSRSRPSCPSRGRRSSGRRSPAPRRSRASWRRSSRASAGWPRCACCTRTRARRRCRRCWRAATAASATSWRPPRG